MGVFGRECAARSVLLPPRRTAGNAGRGHGDGVAARKTVFQAFLELFLEFVGGNVQPAGGSQGGVEFRCAPVADPFRAACMWREGDRLGIVVAVDRDVEAARELLFDARNAIGS